jgi:hypothetical protein
MSDRGRGEDDVGFGENLPEARERDGLSTEALGELACPRVIPIQNPDFGARPEIFCGDPCHFPRANECNDSILDRYDGVEESDGSVARRRVAGGSAGDPADLGRDTGGVKKQVSQGAAWQGAVQSPQRGVPNLRRHLFLAFCEGVQTTGDPNEMCRRIAVIEDVQDRLGLRNAERPANGLGGPARRLR